MTLDECRGWADAFAATHRITVDERAAMPKGTVAFAEWRSRRVVVPPITDFDSFAVRLHEYAHVLAGACTNTAPHYRNPKVQDWWHCLQCEADAWQIAMREFPFTREMFRRLQRSLATYRRTTPAPAAALTTARQLASDHYFAERVQAQAAQDRRLDAYREIQEAAAEAQRPRPLTRRERQIADVDQWAREARR